MKKKFTPPPVCAITLGNLGLAKLSDVDQIKTLISVSVANIFMQIYSIRIGIGQTNIGIILGFWQMISTGTKLGLNIIAGFLI